MPGGRRLGRQELGKKKPELQDRDLFLFRALHKAKVLTTGDLVPLVFPSLPIARRRLRHLVAGRYIAGFVEALHDETRYVLDRRGMVELVEADDLDLTPRSAPRELRGPGEHRLTLVRLWSRVVEGCHSSGGLELLRWSFEWEFEEQGRSYLPDALFVLDNGETERVFAVEVDQGTESPSYVEKHKFQVFARLQAAEEEVQGEVLDAMLVVVPSDRRLRSLARALGESRLPIIGRVFSRGEEGEPVLGRAWYHLGELAAGRELVVAPMKGREGR